MVTVCTVLPPPERPRLDAAGDGCFTTVHTSSFRDALRAARRKRVDALVLSVHACRGDELPAVARFVREFPAIPAVARTVHRAAAGAAPPDLLEYAHVPLLSGEPAVPEDLPRRHAARARGLPVLEPRALGGRRGVPPRLFVAAELRAPPEGDAGCHRGRVSAPLPFRRLARALCGPADHPVPGNPARVLPTQCGFVGPRTERDSRFPAGVISPRPHA